MPSAIELQINAASRLQVIVERLKENQSRELSNEVLSLRGELNNLLSSIDNVQDLTFGQVNDLVSESEAIVSNFFDNNYSQFLESFNRELIDLGIETEQNTLNEVIESDNFEASVPTQDFVYNAFLETAMTDGSANGALLVSAYLLTMYRKEAQRIGSSIRNSIDLGLSTNEVINTVLGTRSNNYADGTINVLRRNADSSMRTVSQHALNVSRMETDKDNGIDKYQFVATLDSKTSVQCRTLDELKEIYEFGKGPLPPMHQNCRSTIIAYIDNRRSQDYSESTRAARGQSGRTNRVDADLGYYDWLLLQPKSFQELAIGVDRTKLLRDGGLSATEFARLNLNKRFEPLTLDEMRALNPQAFINAGI